MVQRAVRPGVVFMGKAPPPTEEEAAAIAASTDTELLVELLNRAADGLPDFTAAGERMVDCPSRQVHDLRPGGWLPDCRGHAGRGCCGPAESRGVGGALGG